MLECNHNNYSNLSYDKLNPHYFCHTCKSHYYNNKYWTKKEWENWIEEIDKKDNKIV